MKRTLLEIFCGLAALVLMVSFNHQIARLQVQNQDVRDLRDRVETALAASGSKQDITEMRQQMLGQMETRLRELETRLQLAAAGSAMAKDLQGELMTAQREVATFRKDVESDVARTKALVDAYIDEVRAKEKDAALKLSETQVAIHNLAGQILPDARELTRTMLLPTVQLNGDDTVGSGTLVFSGTSSKSKKVESYVLTSFHVVRNILADTPKAQADGFDVTIYLNDGKKTVKGKMVASNAKIDAALVKLEGDTVYPNVANAFPRTCQSPIKVWDQVCAVGCPLGNDPVPSNGEVSSLNNELNGSNYWMINAPTYFGNSGGGVYLTGTRQLIGVFSKIYTHGKGNPVVVPHMGLCTPIGSIYEWLTEEGLEHVLQTHEVDRLDPNNLAAPPK
jgi:S1-C subfamily serine protease